MPNSKFFIDTYSDKLSNHNTDYCTCDCSNPISTIYQAQPILPTAPSTNCNGRLIPNNPYSYVKPVVPIKTDYCVPQATVCSDTSEQNILVPNCVISPSAIPCESSANSVVLPDLLASQCPDMPPYECNDKSVVSTDLSPSEYPSELVSDNDNMILLTENNEKESVAIEMEYHNIRPRRRNRISSIRFSKWQQQPKNNLIEHAERSVQTGCSLRPIPKRKCRGCNSIMLTTPIPISERDLTDKLTYPGRYIDTPEIDNIDKTHKKNCFFYEKLKQYCRKGKTIADFLNDYDQELFYEMIER